MPEVPLFAYCVVLGKMPFFRMALEWHHFEYPQKFLPFSSGCRSGVANLPCSKMALSIQPKTTISQEWHTRTRCRKISHGNRCLRTIIQSRLETQLPGDRRCQSACHGDINFEQEKCHFSKFVSNVQPRNMKTPQPQASSGEA